MTRAGWVRASLVIILVSILPLTVLSDTFASTEAEPHTKVWGTVVRLEPNDVVIVEDPAGLEVKLHGDATTVARLRRGEVVKALVDRKGQIVFIESVEASEQAEPRAPDY